MRIIDAIATLQFCEARARRQLDTEREIVVAIKTIDLIAFDLFEKSQDDFDRRDLAAFRATIADTCAKF